MIPHGVSYEEAMRQFRWPRPQRFNIGRAVCERHPSHALALIVENADGSVRNWTFGELLAASSRLANALAARGIRKGDRVGVFLSQGAELTLCHLAGYRMGAVVLPLFTLFGEEALEYRLANAEASALITDMSPAAQGAGGARSAAASQDGDRDRRRRRRRRLSRLGPPAGRCLGRFRHCRYGSRGSGAADLHLGHHRPAQGRAACPSRDAGLGAAGRAVAEPLAARQRGDVDAGRMGVDRRPLRRAVPGLVLRHAGGGASLRQVRSRARLRTAGTGTRWAWTSSRRPRSR